MNIEKIFVVGAGFMGSGIIENAAEKGLQAVAYDVSEKQLEKSKAGIEKSLERKIKKNKLDSKGKDEIMNRITFTTAISDCSDADIVIEAVSENRELKMSIMKEIDKYAKEDAITASNTSSISITALGSVFNDPTRFVGMHFFSPVPRMPLMEVVRGYKSSRRAIDTAKELGELLGKTCIEAKDEAGFIINRMLIPMLNEAIILVERKVGTIEEIDTGTKLGLNHPMGPLELVDMIGIDVELSVMEVLYDEIGDPKYRPAVSLRRMVEAGYLGRKVGEGFYIYNEDGTKTPNPNLIIK